MNNFISTAIYPNRELDKSDLENKLQLPEQGNATTTFYIPQGPLFARGYERIVYGDHGPYLEFDKSQIKIHLISKFGNQVDMENLPGLDYQYYYYWLHPTEYRNIKVYLQIKPVTNLPNAPKRADGRRSSFNRTEGYADYRRGLFYVDPYTLGNSYVKT